MRTNVILAGKCDSHRHSTTTFSENVVVAKTSYQMLGILSFSNQERALPPSTEITELTIVVEKSTIVLSGVSSFREQARKRKIKCHPGSRRLPRI